MSFVLSKKSLLKLQNVNPALVNIVKRAIEITNQDFAVLEGLRTLEKQKEYVAKGTSKTLSSKHLTGDAVDLIAWVNKDYSWDWKYYYPIADAMQKAADELDIALIWGGCWDRMLNVLDNKEKEVQGYILRRLKLGKSAFIDAPHFELVS